MSNFTETDHPRATAGKFTDKPQSAPETTLDAGDPFAADVTVVGWLVDEKGEMTYHEITPKNGSTEKAFAKLLRSSDVVVNSGSGTWRIITPADGPERPTNPVVTDLAATMGYRVVDPGQSILEARTGKLGGPAFFLFTDRGTGKLGYTGRPRFTLESIFHSAHAKAVAKA